MQRIAAIIIEQKIGDYNIFLERVKEILGHDRFLVKFSRI